MDRVRDRGLGTRIAAVVAGLVLMVAFTGAVLAAGLAVRPSSSWVWDEANLWVAIFHDQGLRERLCKCEVPGSALHDALEPR